VLPLRFLVPFKSGAIVRFVGDEEARRLGQQERVRVMKGFFCATLVATAPRRKCVVIVIESHSVGITSLETG